MKIIKITALSLAGLLTALCLYLWSGIMLSKVTGSTPSAFGYQLRLTGEEPVGEHLPQRTLLVMKPADRSLQQGDIIAFTLPGNEEGRIYLGEVTAVTAGDQLVVSYSDLLSELVIPQSSVNERCIYQSSFLGQFVYFSASPEGIVLLVALPLLLLLLLRLSVLYQRKPRKEKTDIKQEEQR